MNDCIEPIKLDSQIRVKFFKHQSKISLQFCFNDSDQRYIYFSEDDQTLKLYDDKIMKYYFKVEFDSETNELLETTKFKIKVRE